MVRGSGVSESLVYTLLIALVVTHGYGKGLFQVFGEGDPEEQVKGQGTKLLKLKTVVNRLVFLDDSPKTWKIRFFVRQCGIHIGHPTTIINQASQGAVTELLVRNNHTIREIVRELLMRQEIIQEQLLIVLEAVNLHEPNALLSLQKQIAALHESPNYAIRTLARTIYHPPVEDSIPKSSPFSTLPAIYSLELPPQGRWSLAGHEEITSLEPAPDTQDPVEIVRPFDIELSFIAQEANLELVNVC